MSLYEELGLSVSAAPEDIRKAHRTLSRLLHPDQQTDESLRQAAELQMRRVNIIVGMLLDPQQRRRYDDSLRATPPEITIPFPVAPRPIPRASFSLLDLIGIIAAAVMVTLLAIWLFAGDFIHWRELGSNLSTSAETMRADTREKFAPSVHEPVRRRHSPDTNPVARPPATASAPLPPIHSVRLPPPLPVAPQHKPAAPLLVLQPDTLALNSSTYPPSSMVLPPASAPEIAILPDNVTPPAWSFTGLWLLPSSGRRAGSRQLPQFIQVGIFRGQDETVFGEYSARYEAPDRPISPEVAFTFQGPVVDKEATFDWSAADGSRGTVELKLLSSRAMRVTWHVREFGTSIGIAGGAAVVIRRAE